MVVSTKPEKIFKLALSEGRIKGAQDMVHKIGRAIYRLDLTIEEWNEQLKRAQPHRNGRLLVSFMKNSYVRIGDLRVYDVEPVVGKMVHMKSGAWRFFKLTSRDKYQNLSDLRVGKGLPSDKLVIRLIDGLEDMLKERAGLVQTLAALRTGTPGKIASIFASCERRSIEAIGLSHRVKIDWAVGAAAAEMAITARRRDRYQAVKEKKMLLMKM